MPYYSVHKGRVCGIFSSWNECKQNTSGFSGAVFKKFTNKEDAEHFLKFGKTDFIIEKSKTQPSITVYTDGACRHNGYSNAIAGIGIYFGKNDKRNVSHRIYGKQTNNIAELTAILEVRQILSSEIDSGTEIEVCSDSKYAIRCCTSYGQKQDKISWSKEIPNKELVKKIYNTYKNYSNVTFRYVKAHTGRTDVDSIGNANADRLANEAI